MPCPLRLEAADLFLSESHDLLLICSLAARIVVGMVADRMSKDSRGRSRHFQSAMVSSIAGARPANWLTAQPIFPPVLWKAAP
jgi:hypothetical protein